MKTTGKPRGSVKGMAFGKTMQQIKRKKPQGEAQWWKETARMVDQSWRNFFEPRGGHPLVPGFLIS